MKGHDKKKLGIYFMQPTREYMDYIAKRLEALNPEVKTQVQIKRGVDPEVGNIVDLMGQSAMNYLQNKKDSNIKSDPLFSDRNTY